MDLGLTGKNRRITGGSKGIGYAAAEAFLKEGASVAICSRHEEELKKSRRKHFPSTVLSITRHMMSWMQNPITVLQSMSIRNSAAWMSGSINVGVSGPKKGDEYDDEEIDFMTGVCFKSVVYGCQAAFRYMKKQHSGAIVNVSSLAARCPSAGRSTLYGPLKSAINNLTNTFAGEYCPYNVRVTCIMPGFTLTPAVKQTISPEELSMNTQATLLRRAAMPEEIARPIVFLASSAASYMTATTIEVSGGRSMTLNPSFAYDRLAAAENR